MRRLAAILTGLAAAGAGTAALAFLDDPEAPLVAGLAFAVILALLAKAAKDREGGE